MCKYLKWFIYFLSVQALLVLGKPHRHESAEDAEHDLEPQEARSYSNFYLNSDYRSSYHHNNFKHHGNAHSFGPPGHHRAGRVPHDPFHIDPHDFPDSFDFDNDDFDFDDHDHHGHHGHHHGHNKHHGHHGFPEHPGPSHHGNGPPQHEPPRRFPPPPVYDKDFINPWLVQTTPKPYVAPGPVIGPPQPPRPPTMVPIQVPSLPPPTIPTTTATRATTTTVPPAQPTVPTSTTNADGLIYDIDLRFGQ